MSDQFVESAKQQMGAVERLLKGLPGISGYVNKDLRRDADKRVREASVKEQAKLYRQHQRETERKRREILKDQSNRDMNRIARAETVLSTAALTDGYTNKDYFERMEGLRERAVEQHEEMNKAREGQVDTKKEERRKQLMQAAQAYGQSAREKGDIGPSSTWTTRMRGYLDQAGELAKKTAKTWVDKYRQWRGTGNDAERQKETSWQDRVSRGRKEMEPER